MATTESPVRAAVVVGFGSIGRRHARLLREMGVETAVVSRRRGIDDLNAYSTLDEALDSCDPGYVVIASRTSEHGADLSRLDARKFGGKVLVEKPIFEDVRELPDYGFQSLHVGYHLRFHQLVQRLRTRLAGRKCFAAHAYVGQHLTKWRPGTDYRQSYSAARAMGGGVLRDLSHELDLVLCLFGNWVRLTAAGGHFSDLETDTEDAVSVLMETERCPVVTVSLNCIDSTPRRDLLVLTDQGSLRIDLSEGVFEDAAGATSVDADYDEPYRNMHRAILDGDPGVACTAEEAAAVSRVIEAIETGVEEGTWIRR